MTRSRQHGNAHSRHNHVRRTVDLPNSPCNPNKDQAQAQALSRTQIHDQRETGGTPVRHLTTPVPRAPERTRQETKKVTAACLACRRRKTKCSGGPAPCSACHQHQSECIIDPASDRRRKVPKAVLQDLDAHAPALSRLVDSLRQSNSTSDRILASIRNGAPLAQVLVLVENSKKGKQRRDVSSTKKLPVVEDQGIENHREVNDDVCPDLAHGYPNGSDTLISSSHSCTRIPGGQHLFNEGDRGIIETTDQYPHNELKNAVDDIILYQRSGQCTKRDRRGWHPSLQLLRSDYSENIEGAAREPAYVVQAHESITGSTFDLYPDATNLLQQVYQQTRSSWQPSPGYVKAFGNLPMSSAFRANGYPGEIQSLQLNNFEMHAYQIVPLNIPENSLLSSITTSFRAAALKMIADGVPVDEVFGPKDPNMDLMVRDRVPTDAFSVSNWAAELCRMFPAYDFPELLRGAYFLTYYMRWTILPTRENYEALPAEYRPTTVQRLIPHSAAVDLQPAAALRNALCLDFRDFQTPQEMAISVNWPYSEDACLQIDPITGMTHLTAAFREHIRDEGNLTFSSLMVEAFPELKGHVNVREKVPR